LQLVTTKVLVVVYVNVMPCLTVVIGHKEVVVYTVSVLVTLAAGLVEEGTQVEGASVGFEQPPLQLVTVKVEVKVVVCV
jgi:hypothetical protein